MENDLTKYFSSYAPVPDSMKLTLMRAATGLRRYGITTMTELCGLCENSPDKLGELRGIGGKSRKLILEICAAYRTEKSKEERK